MFFLLGPLVAILLLFATFSSQNNVDDGAIAIANEETANIGQSMMALHTFASEYASSNSTYVGTASNAVLATPTWYVRPGFVNVYVNAGKAYVYYTGSVQGLPGWLLTTSQDAYGAGVNNNGILVSAGATDTSAETIPTQVPNGAVVLMP
jgi:hypothetical protein